MKGRSFGGYVEWWEGDQNQNTKGQKTRSCVALIVSSDDSMSSLRIVTAYHCLRNLVLDRLASGENQQQIRVSLRTENTPPCKKHFIDIPIILRSSVYLTQLHDKFKQLAEKERLSLPLAPHIKAKDYQPLKTLDNGWLEAFSAPPQRGGPNPLIESLDRGLCSTQSPNSSNLPGDENQRKYQQIINSQQKSSAPPGLQKMYSQTCYLYTDLAHMDLYVEKTRWKGTEPACLEGSTFSDGKVKNHIIPWDFPELTLSQDSTPGPPPNTQEWGWDEIRQHLQLSVPSAEQQNLLAQGLAKIPIVTRKAASSKFNQGTRDDTSDDDNINIIFTEDLELFTVYSAYQKPYKFLKYPLARKEDYEARPQNDYKYQWRHVFGVVSRLWGFAPIYDAQSINIYKGSSGSLIISKGKVLAALYSSEGEEYLGAPIIPTEESVHRHTLAKIPHTPIHAKDRTEADQLPTAQNQPDPKTSAPRPEDSQEKGVGKGPDSYGLPIKKETPKAPPPPKDPPKQGDNTEKSQDAAAAEQNNPPEAPPAAPPPSKKPPPPKKPQHPESRREAFLPGKEPGDYSSTPLPPPQWTDGDLESEEDECKAVPP